VTAMLDHPVAVISAQPIALVFTAPAPIVPGEDASVYHDLRARIFADAKPRGFLEELWVHDVVEVVWDVVRLRRYKAHLLASCAVEGLYKVLISLDVRDSYNLSKGWAARDEAAVAKVNALLAAAGLTIDAVMARTYEAKMGVITSIDAALMKAEARRAAALRELTHHRSTFAETLRRAAAAAEDAELKLITVAAPVAPDAA
jgi:hypothetical protein